MIEHPMVHLELLLESEAAEIMRSSPRTLQSWRARGEGPKFIKLGRGIRAKVAYRRADIDAWIEAGLRASTAERRAA